VVTFQDLGYLEGLGQDLGRLIVSGMATVCLGEFREYKRFAERISDALRHKSGAIGKVHIGGQCWGRFHACATYAKPA
jgi:hypothetical protein